MQAAEEAVSRTWRIRPITIIGLVIGATLFIIDTFFPRGILIPIFYVIVILAFYWAERRWIYEIAIVISVLTTAGFLLSPLSEHEVNFTNRLLSLTLIWVIAVFAHRKLTEDRHVAQLAAIVESTDDAAIGLRLDGIITNWNNGARRTYGYWGSEIIGRHISLLVDPDQAARFEATFRRIQLGEGIDHFETTHHRRDGENIAVSLTISPVRDHTGSVVSASIIARDITAIKAALDHIKTLNDQLERRVTERTAQLVDANKEIAAFSYSIAHDLRAPLRAINSFARILLDEHTAQLDNEGKRYLEVIRKNSIKMGQLIDDLLSFHRITSQDIEPATIDMAALAQSVVYDLLEQEPDRVVRTVIHPLPPAHGEAALIRQVLTNLVANALKFTRGQKDPCVEIGAATEGGVEVVFSVKDNGVGFDVKYANKLFGIFQRLHTMDEFEGTGIGLAIVKRIITRHGGRVWAEGSVGHGATFYFSLRSAVNQTVVQANELLSSTLFSSQLNQNLKAGVNHSHPIDRSW